MEENENLNEENKQQVKNEGELKKEATETFKETKEQIKNINFKEEAQKGKGLLGKLFGRPVETIKEIVEDNKNQFYQTTLLIIIVWIVLIFLRRIIDFIIYDYYKSQGNAQLDEGVTCAFPRPHNCNITISIKY